MYVVKERPSKVTLIFEKMNFPKHGLCFSVVQHHTSKCIPGMYCFPTNHQNASLTCKVSVQTHLIMQDYSGVVLSAHGRIITAMETGGLYYMMTLHTLFYGIIEILQLLCLSPSSH